MTNIGLVALQRAGAKGQLGHGEQRSVENIITSARRMDAMIQDLVDSTRFESGQLYLDRQPVSLLWFVHDLLDRSQPVLDVDRVDVELPGDLPPVSADPNRLERILTNLLSNALKYSEPDTRVLVSGRVVGEEMEVSIVDHGVGISPADVPHIFDRFYRTHQARRGQGIGLGLYITRMLVEAHGGRIWAESEPGKGSTFHFSVPADEKTKPGS